MTVAEAGFRSNDNPNCPPEDIEKALLPYMNPQHYIRAKANRIRIVPEFEFIPWLTHKIEVEIPRMACNIRK
jgi:hypothetical protein